MSVDLRPLRHLHVLCLREMLNFHLKIICHVIYRYVAYTTVVLRIRNENMAHTYKKRVKFKYNKKINK